MVRWRQDTAAGETGSEKNTRRSEGLYIGHTPRPPLNVIPWTRRN